MKEQFFAKENNAFVPVYFSSFMFVENDFASSQTLCRRERNIPVRQARSFCGCKKLFSAAKTQG
jgi:hypothetical protein